MGIAACVLAAAVGAAIFFGFRGGGGHSAQPQGHASAPISGRSAPPQGGASGLVALTRVDAGRSHIMLVDPSGRSRPRDLGPGWGASWSPDGRKLVFTYEVPTPPARLVGRGLGGGLERVFVMNADGSGRHLLAMPWLSSTRFEDSGPAWSPDGSRIAFTRTVWPPGAPGRPPGAPHGNQGRSADYVLDLAHGGQRRLSPPLDIDSRYVIGIDLAQVTWSPDGRLAYLAPAGRCSYAVLHITNADGTGDNIIWAASRPPGKPNGCLPIAMPAWSPDGRWIAFARAKTLPTGVDLYLISPNGKHLHRLTHQPNLNDFAPAWSPDGKRIAFEVVARGENRPRHPALAVIDRDGSHRHTILHVRGYMYGRGPAWQPR